jgi:hypothetical protein
MAPTHLVHTSQGFSVLSWILESHFCYKIPHTSYTQVKDSACWVEFWNLTFVTRFHTPRTHKSRIPRVGLDSGISLLLQDSTVTSCFQKTFQKSEIFGTHKSQTLEILLKRDRIGEILDFGWQFHNAHNNLCASRERTGA